MDDDRLEAWLTRVASALSRDDLVLADPARPEYLYAIEFTDSGEISSHS